MLQKGPGSELLVVLALSAPKGSKPDMAHKTPSYRKQSQNGNSAFESNKAIQFIQVIVCISACKHNCKQRIVARNTPSSLQELLNVAFSFPIPPHSPPSWHPCVLPGCSGGQPPRSLLDQALRAHREEPPAAALSKESFLPSNPRYRYHFYSLLGAMTIPSIVNHHVRMLPKPATARLNCRVRPTRASSNRPRSCNTDLGWGQGL